MGDRPPTDVSKFPLDFSTTKSDYTKYTNQPTQLEETQFNDVDDPPVIMTIGHQRDLGVISGWVESGHPFIIVGSEGCGKNLLV